MSDPGDACNLRSAVRCNANRSVAEHTNAGHDAGPRTGLWFLLPALVLLVGCTSIHTEVGRPLQEASSPFVEGATSVESVVHELGPPHKISYLPGGFAFLYEYSFVKELQLGIGLKYFHLPYLKLTEAQSDVSETALLLIFDEQGLLRAQGSEAWREKLGAGIAVQWIFSVHGLTDMSAFRKAPEQFAWGRAMLERPPETLNRDSGMALGSNGFQQRMSPVFVGQSTLEMAKPKPVKLKPKRNHPSIR
jgi:hypothetical protein